MVSMVTSGRLTPDEIYSLLRSLGVNEQECLRTAKEAR